MLIQDLVYHFVKYIKKNSFQILNTDSPSNPITNWITIVGGQGQCLPGDELRCGDGQLAQRAQLIQPKGVAVSAEGHIVFVDGTTIRKVR